MIHTTTILDLIFPVVGTQVPIDHAYPLFSVVCHQIPGVHDGRVPFALLPITGIPTGKGMLHIDSKSSRFRLRIEADHIPEVLRLAGKELKIAGKRLRIGIPSVAPLCPSPNLVAKSVTFKNAMQPAQFLERAKRELESKGINGSLEIPDHISKTGEREPHRHILRIRGSRIVCFSLLVKGLSEEESLKLQCEGIGGRRRMGGGVFIAARSGGKHDE